MSNYYLGVIKIVSNHACLHRVLQHPPLPCGRGKLEKNLILKFLDVFSLYPGNGVTDAVIDFYRV